MHRRLWRRSRGRAGWLQARGIEPCVIHPASRTHQWPASSRSVFARQCSRDTGCATARSRRSSESHARGSGAGHLPRQLSKLPPCCSVSARRRASQELAKSGHTREEVAELYNLALSTVGGFIKRKRETGSVSPAKFGGHKTFIRLALAKEKMLWGRRRGWHHRCYLTTNGAPRKTERFKPIPHRRRSG
jgi:hypothetical protein